MPTGSLVWYTVQNKERIAAMEVPIVGRAEEMLAEATALNPGPWADHSRVTAENAGHIAEKCAGIDPEAAYVMGLLHDIGRREGVYHLRHVLDGYIYLTGLGYGDGARICLTHSFPIPDMHTYLGKLDCTHEQADFLDKYLRDTEYDDYDRLIQLCDALSLPQGAVVMEKRFVDVAMRYGLPDFTLRRWQAKYELKAYFDQRAGCNIYTLLPGIAENTLAF